MPTCKAVEMETGRSTSSQSALDERILANHPDNNSVTNQHPMNHIKIQFRHTIILAIHITIPENKPKPKQGDQNLLPRKQSLGNLARLRSQH